jgi:hypothetical protein
VISHLDVCKTTTLTKTQGILNIIKMEDLHDTHDCRAKQYYPDASPNPKCIKCVFNLWDACNSGN